MKNALALLWFIAAALPAERYTASLAAGEATVDWESKGGVVTGTLTLPNGVALGLRGIQTGSSVSGLARAGTESEKFTATIAGNQLNLRIGNIDLVFSKAQAPVVSAAPVTAGSQSISDPSLPFRFTIPSGWLSEKHDLGYLLGHASGEPRVLVMQHTSNTMDEMRRLSNEGFHYGEAIQLNPAGPIQPVSAASFARELSGKSDGRSARAYFLVLMSPHGGGGAMLLAGGAAPSTAGYASAANTIAASIQWIKVDTSSLAAQWSARLRGKKLHYFSRYNSGGSSGGYAEHKYMGLCSDGSFFFRGDFSGSITVPGATASMGKNRGDVGRWKVVPQGTNAALQLVFQDGSQAVFTLGTEDGKTFLNGTRWMAEDAQECR